MFNQRLEKDKNDDLFVWEKRLDEIYDKGALAIDFDERKKYYDEYQQIAYEEKPFIYIYSPIVITAIRNKYKNVFPTTLGGATHNIEEIYIDKEGGK